jgi:DNA-binding transcriptional MerR regulator
VADELEVPQHVLRFWESRFAQIRPVKRAGGRRYYRPEDVDLIKGIQALLHGEGFTIKGVQKVLKERGARHVAEVGRKGVAAPTEPVVIEKIVYVQKAVVPRKRPTHLRAVPQEEMSLPFFDPPAAVVKAAQEGGPAFLDGPEEEAVELGADRVAIEERARLEELLDELMGLKERLAAVRSGG